MRILLLLIVFSFSVLHSTGQAPRVILLEEFTGEECMPCGVFNPSFFSAVNHFGEDVVLIKFQDDLIGPAALNEQTKAEVDARMNYYTMGSNPSMRQDGAKIGPPLSYSHISNWTYDTSYFSTRNAVPSPMYLYCELSFNAAKDSFFCTVDIKGAMPYTATGNGKLKLRVAMLEDVTFLTPPGQNGETEFPNVMRKMYPSVNGTTLQNSWSTGLQQTFQFADTIPSYIYNADKIKFAAFIQDDGTGFNVLQAAYSVPAQLALDLQPKLFTSGFYTCDNSYTPGIQLYNPGTSTVTSCTIKTYVNGTAANTYSWTGNLTERTSTAVTLPAVSGLKRGLNELMFVVTDPNGQPDMRVANDTLRANIGFKLSAAPAAYLEDFENGIDSVISYSAEHDKEKWVLTDTGYNSRKSMMLNLRASSMYDRDYFYLRPLYFSSDTSKLIFRHAYSQNSSPYDSWDQLEVSASLDCGATWELLYEKRGDSLGPWIKSKYVHVIPPFNVWASDTIDLSAYRDTGNVLIRFGAESRFGGALFIDDIRVTNNVAGPVDTTVIPPVDTTVDPPIDTTIVQGLGTPQGVSAKAWPNPFNNSLQLSVISSHVQPARIAVYNIAGAVQFEKTVFLQAADNNIQIDSGVWAAGLYYVLVSSDDGTWSGKVVKE